VRLLHDMFLVLLVAITSVAAISARVLVTSVEAGDADSAWLSASVFLFTSILDAFLFWPLV
jgi:hypothetical protein